MYCIHCGVHWHMGVSVLYAYCSMCTCAHVRVRYLSRVRTVFVCSCTHCTHHVLKCVVTRGLAWSFLCRLLVLLCPALWPYTKALRTNTKWCSRHERSSQTIQLACCVLLSYQSKFIRASSHQYLRCNVPLYLIFVSEVW